MKNQVFALLSLCLWLQAAAQETARLDGTWRATFHRPDGTPWEAQIAVADGKGTYWVIAKRGSQREDPCVGRKFPITVTNVATDAFVIQIQGSKALQGCPDFRVILRPSDRGDYEGAFPNGQKYVFVRQR